MSDLHEPTSLCEIRFDVPLARTNGQAASRFERAWRAELAAQKKTALAMPPARAVAARFRLVGPETPELGRHIQARLAALPGAPAVARERDAAHSQTLGHDWAGVQIWLTYPAADLPALLRAPKTAKNAKTNPNLSPRLNRFRGHRP